MHKKIILLLSLFLVIILGYCHLGSNIPQYQKNNGQVVFLNIGQGDAILIQQQNFQILIDGGKGDAILSELSKYMHFSDRTIEIVILTHPDEDHMGGLLHILEKYQVEQIIESGVSCDKNICKQWTDLIHQQNIPVMYAQAGQEIILNDIRLTILYPFENMHQKQVKDHNDTSLVIKAHTNRYQFLFTGDINQKIEQLLVDKQIDLHADILKIAHHGSKHSSAYTFLKTVSPTYAIISVGKNSYGHPAEEVLNRLQNMNINIMRTDQLGSVVFDL